MYCFGTESAPDWNALSAIGTLAAAGIALGVWLHDRWSKRSDRKGEARVVAMLMLSELAALLSITHTLASMIPRDPVKKGQAIKHFAGSPADLARNLSLAMRLRTPRFERLAERSSVLPGDATAAIASLLTSLRAIEMMFDAITPRKALSDDEVIEVLVIAHGLHEDAKKTHLALASATGASKEKLKALTSTLEDVPAE